MKIRTLATGLAIAGMALGGTAPAMAQTSASSLQALIQSLQAKVRSLRVSLDEIRRVEGEMKLVAGLKEGASGENVKILQAVLAANPDVYPEGLVTGFYGPLTDRAVEKFQKLHGLEEAGNVGPKTLEKLNEFLGKNLVTRREENLNILSVLRPISAREPAPVVSGADAPGNNATSSGISFARPDVTAFFPSKKTTFYFWNGRFAARGEIEMPGKELMIDLDGDGVEEIAFAYTFPLFAGKEEAGRGRFFAEGERVSFGGEVKILKYSGSGGWQVAFEDFHEASEGVENIEKVSGPDGKEAVLALLDYCGSVCGADWHLIASAGGKISELDPHPIVAMALADPRYEEFYYCCPPAVTSAGNVVVETRGLWGMPAALYRRNPLGIRIKFKFTGGSIEFDSVEEL